MIQRPFWHMRTMFIGTLLVLWAMVAASCQAPKPVGERADAEWAASAKSNPEALAFTLWVSDDPPVVPESCAGCHSTSVYHDFLGLDGATPGVVDHPVPIGETIGCVACHNAVLEGDHTVVFPSGHEVADLGANASCSDCHSGRTSTLDVARAVEGLENTQINDALTFINIHSDAAAAMRYGTEANSGYEYTDRTYAGFYQHVDAYATCNDCHRPHTWEVPVRECSVCHLNAKTTADLKQIRRSSIDYDGDGDISEGLDGEIQTMTERLWLVLETVSDRTDETDKLVYTPSFPYFANEAGEPYQTWTPQLLRAAYNYQYAQKGKGAYAHNAPYMMQLLYDSLEDLGVETAGMTRPE